MTTVLVVGPLAEGDMAWYVARTLERHLGMKTERLDPRRLVRLGRPGRMGKAIEHSAIGPILKKSALQRALKEKAARADLVIVVKGDHLEGETISDVASSRPICNWYPDHPVFDGRYEAMAAYTKFYAKDSWSAARLEGMGLRNVAWLPHGTDPELIQSPPGVIPVVDAAVVGRLYPYRIEVVRAIARRGVRCGLWGDSPGAAGELFDVVDPRWRAGRDHAAAFRSGMVVLNTHFVRDIVGGNKRVFDASAAGALQVTERQRDTMVAYDEGESILLYETVSEAAALIKAAVAGEIDVRRMGEAARRRTIECHTYTHRVRRIVGELL